MKRHSGTGVSTRSKGVEKHASGALESWGGIVSGHVSDYVGALDVSPEAVLQAAEEVELMFDTANPKNTRGDDPDRPTDPTLRCLAVTTENARRLAEIARSENQTEPAHA